MGSLICGSDMSVWSESEGKTDKSGKRYCWRGDKTACTKFTVLFLEFSDSSLLVREPCFSFLMRILCCYAIVMSTSFDNR